MGFFENRRDLAFQFGIGVNDVHPASMEIKLTLVKILQRFEFGRGLNTTETLKLKAVHILPPPDPVRV